MTIGGRCLSESQRQYLFCGFMSGVILLSLCLGCKTVDSSSRAKVAADPEMLNRFGFVANSGRKGEFDHIDIWVGEVKKYPAMRILTATGVDLYIAKTKRVKNNAQAQKVCEQELGSDWRLPSIYDYLSFLINGGVDDLYAAEGALHIINKDRVDVPVWLHEENKVKQEKLLKTDEYFLIGEGFSEEYVSLSKTVADLTKTVNDKKSALSSEDKAKVQDMIKELKQGIAVLCFAGILPEDA